MLHTIHTTQSSNSWEAAGWNTYGDPNDPNYGIPDTYRSSFEPGDMCAGCHAAIPIIAHVSPNQQEPTIYKSYEANWLTYALGYTVTAPRWGQVKIYGYNFGANHLSGDEVRIGDPRAGAPIELQYDTNGDPFTVETIDGGLSLYIGAWDPFSVSYSYMIGVYLYPKPGQYLDALYGPNVGLNWLDTWLGLWVVKNNYGYHPEASNVKPIKVLTPLPD
jgi:hypothetical protein